MPCEFQFLSRGVGTLQLLFQQIEVAGHCLYASLELFYPNYHNPKPDLPFRNFKCLG
jgi:hypothetical protein